MVGFVIAGRMVAFGAISTPSGSSEGAMSLWKRQYEPMWRET